MPATKLFVENYLRTPLYVLVKVERRTLRLVISARPAGNAQLLPPGKFMSFPVNDAVRRCFRGAALQYEIVNRSGGSIVFEGGRERKPEGPIFKIEPLLN